MRVVNYPITSDAVSKDFDDSGDTLYNIPMQLPKNQGVLVKAQEFPMTYPKLKLPDPVTPGQTLVMPQIGTPAAGPPTCVTDDSPREDCQIPGKQYRFMLPGPVWGEAERSRVFTLLRATARPGGFSVISGSR